MEEVLQAEIGRARAAAAREDVAAVVAADTAFAFDLYRALAPGDRNLFLSPFSISAALAMTSAGARGETAEEMAATLHAPFSGERLHAARNRLDLDLARTSEREEALKLRLANSLWGQAGFAFEQAFLEVLAAYYGAGLRLVDFERDGEGARATINDWVEQNTEGRIRDLIVALDATTRLVLVNAVYFKARWVWRFDPEATKEEPFHALGGRTCTVRMMHKNDFFAYLRADGYAAIKLPYLGGASMLVLVPDEGRFAGFETRLDAQLLATIRNGLSVHEVDLGFPRFENTSEFVLSGVLRSLGMPSAFEPPEAGGGADFTGMRAERDLFIGGVLHKAFIKVDEEGTEAAAATAVIMRAVSAPVAPAATLIVDRPFFFAVQDDETQALLFVGRITDPG